MREVNHRLSAVCFLKEHASKLPLSQGSVLMGNRSKSSDNNGSIVGQPYEKVNAMHDELCRVHALLGEMTNVKDAIKAIKIKTLTGMENLDITAETNVVFAAFDSEEVNFTSFLDIVSSRRRNRYLNFISSPATKKTRIGDAINTSVDLSCVALMD